MADGKNKEALSEEELAEVTGGYSGFTLKDKTIYRMKGTDEILTVYGDQTLYTNYDMVVLKQWFNKDSSFFWNEKVYNNAATVLRTVQYLDKYCLLDFDTKFSLH